MERDLTKEDKPSDSWHKIQELNPDRKLRKLNAVKDMKTELTIISDLVKENLVRKFIEKLDHYNYKTVNERQNIINDVCEIAGIEQLTIPAVVKPKGTFCETPDKCQMSYYHQISDYYCSKCEKTGLV